MLSIIIPNYGDFFIYILTDPTMGNWSFQTISYASLVGGVLYACCMAGFLALISSLPFKRIYLIGGVAFVSASIAAAILPFADKVSQPGLFALVVFANFLADVGSDCLTIPVIGRFSSNCPKGLENFGISTLLVITVLFNSLSGYLSSSIVSVFSIEEGNYGKIFTPLVITVCLRITALVLTIFFVKS
jgi:hypothetical protein